MYLKGDLLQGVVIPLFEEYLENKHKLKYLPVNVFLFVITFDDLMKTHNLCRG